jgi:hypothetical protein
LGTEVEAEDLDAAFLDVNMLAASEDDYQQQEKCQEQIQHQQQARTDIKAAMLMSSWLILVLSDRTTTC